MPSPHRIEVDEIVRDIREGLTDHELMKRYELSAKGLKNTLERLVEAEAVQLTEVYRRPVFYDDSLDDESRREYPRHYLALLLPVYEADREENRGWLTDVSEQGLGVIGLSVEQGEKKTLAIIPGKFSDRERILVEAECHWTEREQSAADLTSGFHITSISEVDLEEL